MAQITNQATLSYTGGTVASNIATGEVVDVLTVAKSAIPETYGPGDNVTYIINVVNSGDADVTGVTLTDDLGAYPFGEGTLVPLTYVEGTVKVFENGAEVPKPTVTHDGGVTFSGVTVPAGGNTTVIYIAKVNSYAPLGDGSVTNTATADAAGMTPVEASATVTPAGGADLTITKSISPSIVRGGGQVTYTFVIRNYGPAAADAAANVTVTDTMDPELSDLTSTLDGAPFTSFTYENALFATTPGAITVPAATYEQDATTGEWMVTPGETTLTVSGNIQ